MRTRKLLAAMLSAATLCAVTVTVSAEVPQGYVTFYADKTVIGQGLVVEPVSVPFYEGDNGIDVVQRAADVLVVDGDWGSYIEGFADIDTGAQIPDEIAGVCPEMGGRNTEGYLCSLDYTSESGWSWFLNDEYASVGIADYVPADGDVVQFRFTVFGYGSDLGIDNSSWGGSPALVEAVKTAELAELVAASSDIADSDAYVAALETLGTYAVSQADIDAASAALADVSEESTNDSTSDTLNTSPDTGVEGVAAVIGIAAIAGVALAVTKKR